MSRGDNLSYADIEVAYRSVREGGMSPLFGTGMNLDWLEGRRMREVVRHHNREGEAVTMTQEEHREAHIERQRASYGRKGIPKPHRVQTCDNCQWSCKNSPLLVPTGCKLWEAIQ